MHPLTLYDIAMLEHTRASSERDLEHQLTLRRRERQSALPSQRPAPRGIARRLSRDDPTPRAGGAPASATMDA